jgi:hypothetical protein
MSNNPENSLMMQKTLAEWLFNMSFIGKTYMVRYVLLLFALFGVYLICQIHKQAEFRFLL